jgi:transcriptional regulator with XRE-family HTH domain
MTVQVRQPGSPSTVRALRLLRGITVADLARDAGVDFQTLRSIEAGRGSPRTRAAVARALRARGPLFEEDAADGGT